MKPWALHAALLIAATGLGPLHAETPTLGRAARAGESAPLRSVERPSPEPRAIGTPELYEVPNQTAPFGKTENRRDDGKAPGRSPCDRAAGD